MTSSNTQNDAWAHLLQREFKGLEKPFYRERFETEIEDVYLRKQAIASLSKAGNDQQFLYNFSHQVWANQKSFQEGKYSFC